MTDRVLSFLIFLFMLASALPSKVLGDDDRFSVEIAFEYATGEYGTDTTTDSVTVPLTVGFYPTDRLDFELTVPYIYQSNSATTPSGPIRFKTSHQITTPTGRGMGRSGSSQFSKTFDTTKSQSGVGDMTLQGGYVFIQERDNVPEIRPYVYVKFPTADETKGLGTGEFDEGVGVELSKWFGDFYTAVNGTYVFQGETPDFDLKDYFTYGVEAGSQLTDDFRPSLVLYGATPPSDDSSALLEIGARARYELTENTGINGYVLRGLTNGSPDFGIGISASYDF